MINNLIWSMFEGYKDSETTKQKQHDNNYLELQYTPFLFSSNHLESLYENAQTTQDCNMIMSYLRKHNCIDQGIYNYDRIYNYTNEKLEKLHKREEKRNGY